MYTRGYLKIAVAAAGLLFTTAAAIADDDQDSNPLEVKRVSWNADRSLLIIKLEAEKRQTIRIENAYASTQVLARKTLKEDELKLRLRRPQPVPCRVKVSNETTGEIIERNVLDTRTRSLPNNCSPKSPDEPPIENQPPIANAGADQTLTLASGQSSINVALNGSASKDPDGSITKFTWNGSPNPADVASPNVSLSAGTHLFTLTVTDNDGAVSNNDVVLIKVEAAAVVNKAPVANAGADQTLTLASGQSNINVSLNGGASSDPDGSIAKYTWNGSVNPADVVSPNVSLNEGTHQFTLTVTDNEGAVSASDSVIITVEAAPVVNKAPLANAGADQTLTLTSGQSNINVSLNGSASTDPDGTITKYTWNGSTNPTDVVAPKVSLSEGTHQFTLTVTDNEGAVSSTDSVMITVEPAPVVNQAPVANAGIDQALTLGPNQSNVNAILDASASYDPDGTINSYVWNGSPSPTDTLSPTISLGVGTHLFTLVVTDDQGMSSAEANVQITVHPFPTTAAEAHATIGVYEGPATCIACHENQAVDMHGSVHYQQTGPAYNVTNIVPTLDNPLGLAGERGNGAIGINTYCGSHENSPRFTCAGCHVGNGRFPDPELPQAEPARSQELSNIDCLMCHQETYKRFPAGEFEPLEMVRQGNDGKPDPFAQPIVQTGEKGIPMVDPNTKDFLFEPADAESLLSSPLMSISRHEAARTVHATTRKSCLNCHGGAGGGDGTKRGDMSSALIDPAPHIDIHMSASGHDLTCANCHDAGGHRVRGRGLDLRPNDVAEQFSCESCHDNPHGDYSNTRGSSRDKHASRVACQTCHIPTYAKDVPTEVSRDWENPHFSPKACNGRGGWLPEEIKASDLQPTYNWFDGTSQVYVLGENLDDYPTTILPDGSQAITLGLPNGWVDSMGAKIYPMKEHTSKSAVHEASNTLIAHSTFDFFRTGSFDTAVQSALQQTGREGDNYTVVKVHTFQTINHGVESSNSALECGECHSDSRLSGGPLRMNLQADLGYGLKGSESSVCSQCHGNERSEGFVKTHQKHVEDKRYDCSHCHEFSRPERGLKMNR